jgi:hypothetical protein
MTIFPHEGRFRIPRRDRPRDYDAQVVPIPIIQPILAHPLTEVGRLEVPPLAAAVTAMVVVAAVARFWPADRVRAGGQAVDSDTGWPAHSWFGALGPAHWVTRALGVLLLLLAAIAGRVGSESEIHNLAPALVVGAGWPLLITGSLLVGAIWRWVDPWDASARFLGRDAEQDPVADATWAVVPAAALAWYVGALPNPYSPRAIGFGLAAYTLVTVGGCLVLGRARWLSRAEVFGLMFTWAALVRGRRARAWRPPRNAEIVLGVVAGGLVFSVIRRSALWGGIAVRPRAVFFSTLAVMVLAGGFALLLWWLERRGRRDGVAGSVPVAVMPAVVSLVLALAMYSNVLFTSISLIPELLADPLGLGWRLLPFDLPLFSLCGTGESSCVALVAVQSGVLLAGGILGGIVLAHRVPRPAARQPGMAALCLVVAGGVVAVAAS